MINIKVLSEEAVVVQFGDEISETVLNHITLFNKLLHQNPFPGFIETVPAYVSLTVYFNPEMVLSDTKKGVHAYDWVIQYLKNLPLTTDTSSPNIKEPIQIPVCYASRYSPDLPVVAEHNHLSTEEVIAIHTAATYTVYMIGFMPGFPYLGGMSPAIATPRKQSPRPLVEKGSVGIAGAQTGIYPADSPGGWQLIGRTPIKLFDVSHPPYSLLKAGDRLQFYAISVQEFEKLQNAARLCA
ncbi:5-oxoprolinase subunit PxpB [Olivibacter sitiensis]|uniref:5-oxoprolinase subunit PxpB n=1 Tax=Olivibacter sitiensis TaxID=376470 RepID=UPI0004103260|nr:5-oxoprolinase subunit PxpB [Olivibacter sitiensis]